MASPRLRCRSNLCLRVREGGNFFHFLPWCILVFSWWISGQFKSGNPQINQSSPSVTMIFSLTFDNQPKQSQKNPPKQRLTLTLLLMFFESKILGYRTNVYIYLTTTWRNFTMSTCMSFHCIQNAIFHIVYMSVIATAAKTVLTLTLDQLLMIFQDPAKTQLNYIKKSKT